MEIGMKGWLALVVGAMGVVAVQTLPPDPLVVERAEVPERARFEQALSDVRGAHGVIQLTRWSDSLSALVVSADPGSIVFSAPEQPRVTPAGVAEWQESYASELAGLSPRDPNVRLGVFWQRSTHGTVPGVTPGPVGGGLVFAGVRDGVPYCFVTWTYFGTAFQDADLRDAAAQDLGACRLYAAYGVPGPRIAAWLDAGGWGFAAQAEPIDGPYALRSDAPRALMRQDAPLFGTRRHPLADQNVFVQSCLAGAAPSCLRAVTDPALIAPVFQDRAFVAANSPLSSYFEPLGPVQPPFGYLDDNLLAEVEAEFGADSFERFWKSDEPAEVAFASAFGVDMAEWLLDLVEEEAGLYRAGPGIRFGDALQSVLTLMALTASASAVAMRRRAG